MTQNLIPPMGVNEIKINRYTYRQCDGQEERKIDIETPVAWTHLIFRHLQKGKNQYGYSEFGPLELVRLQFDKKPTEDEINSENQPVERTDILNLVRWNWFVYNLIKSQRKMK